jgi:hypothetical protein
MHANPYQKCPENASGTATLKATDEHVYICTENKIAQCKRFDWSALHGSVNDTGFATVLKK